jgi:7-cyano-7-deazaguanine synthase
LTVTKYKIVKGYNMSETVTPPKQKPIVMLYSGGADSVLMLRLAQMSGRQPHCVLINYGQKHVDELNMAENQLSDAGVQYQVITIEGLNVDSGLTGDLGEARWDNVHEMHVPARNTIFIGLAMSVAEHKGIDEVWYGSDYSDRENLFPDCYQEYVVKMNEMMAIAGPKPIKLHAPLLGMTKEVILEMLDCFWSIKKDKLYSGYEASE